MKTILIALITGFTFITVPSNHICAQNYNKLSDSSFKENLIPSVRHLAGLKNLDLTGANILSRNEINIWAVRDFLNRFEKIDNALWFSTANGGFEAYFIQDGYGNRVNYDNRGVWYLTLINYGEDKLSRDIRTAVKSIYFDFSIVLVEEVQTIEGVEHIVFLEDKSKIIVVKVNKEDEIEVLNDMSK